MHFQGLFVVQKALAAEALLHSQESRFLN